MNYQFKGPTTMTVTEATMVQAFQRFLDWHLPTNLLRVTSVRQTKSGRFIVETEGAPENADVR